jgi:oligopeptide transport system substrate-binding protein
MTRFHCFLFFSLLFIFSCARKDNNPNVFYYNQPEGIRTLDPAFAKNQPIMWAVHQLYNTLLEVDSQLHIKPSLAKHWTISEDRLTYTFFLRDDVYFHDHESFFNGKGRKLVAEDVVYSFNRIIDPSVASPGAWIFNGRVDTTQPFSAMNDTVFQLKLIRPCHPILGILSMQYSSVVPKEAVELYGKDFGRHPVGSGPFVFKNWDEGQSLILLKNKNYFEKDEMGNSLPYIGAVKVSFVDNKTAEFLEFRQGRLDFVNDIDANFKDEILSRNGELKKEWQGKITLQKHPYLNTEYLGFLCDTNNVLLKNSPLRLKEIRQAMNYAIDKRKMMLYLRNSIGTPAEAGFVPVGMPGFEPGLVKGYTYDKQKALQLLNEAGYPGGKGLPVTKLLTVPVYAELGAFIARQFEECGIPVQVETVQRSTLLEQIANGQALFFRGSWIADYPDAENYLSVFYGENPVPPNNTRFSNKKYDELYRLALQENNDSIRMQLNREMDQLAIDEAPVIPLWYDMAIHLVQPNVSGFHPNALNLLELRRASKK